ncbi:PAS domain-containing sensor histidine kinase [Adhaeribacter aquaticus]|uniref:PAS domain-containing sensor histidine kinase n=1 Tax=Adhaeribacter aquaticus TaxID=299567 RepID=UPI0005538EDB|nr:PAS domain-containing sensor histidine kinase [Adhaeribacter aquaticus]
MDLATFKFLANNSRQAIFVYETVANKFSYFNSTFEATFNLTLDVPTSPESLLQLVHPEDRQYVLVMSKLLMKGEENKDIEFRITLPENKEQWVCLTPLLSEEGGKQKIIGYLDDITAHKKYNDYLKKYANKKNSILHILAHDLAEPMAIINSLSGVLLDDVKSYGNEEVNQALNLIGKTSSNAVLLIRDLISAEFLETAEVNVIKRRTNLVDRLKEIMQQYQKSEKEISKTFYFLPNQKEIYVEIDDIKLLQAINNLISNAIKFTPKKGVISVSLEEKEETVLIKVEDNGIGIPQKYHNVLFDKFTKASRPGLNGEPSNGLGMSIIKIIVEWHNGQIWFESEENKGTTFFIELPKT